MEKVKIFYIYRDIGFASELENEINTWLEETGFEITRISSVSSERNITLFVFYKYVPAEL